MKKMAIFLGVISLFSLSFTTSAFAQLHEKADRAISTSQGDDPSTPQSTPPTYPGVLLSTETVLGSNIRDPQGEEVGEIKHLMIDPQTGDVRYAVVSVGGFLGMGEKTIIVPWSALEVARDGRSIVLNASKQLLQDAPEYKQGKAVELAEHNQSGGETNTQDGRLYDPEKEQAINGKVVGVKTGVPMEGMPSGVQMVVKTAKIEAMHVYLGPEWYVKRQGMEIRDNADVQVTGVFAALDEQSVLMARTVKFGGQTLTLRDEKGQPLWNGPGNGTKQSGQVSSQR